MSEITITLLNNKSTVQKIDNYQVNAVVNRAGYQVAAGENNSTEITVQYPPQYKNQMRFVHMVNALGENTQFVFESVQSTRDIEKAQINGIVKSTNDVLKNKGFKQLLVRDVEDENLTFSLPATMTVAGATWLTFFALESDASDAVKTVWQSVHIPVLATHVDYKKAAMASPDILEDAIKAIEQIRKLTQKPDLIEDGGAIDVAINKDKGNFVFSNVKGSKGDKGDIGEQGNIGDKGDKGDKGDTGEDGGLTIDAQNQINANTVVAQDAKAVADSVRQDANNGVFNGKDGVDGKDGKDGTNGINGQDGAKGNDGISIPADSGMYRVEVRADGNLWVVTAENNNTQPPLSINSNGELILSI